MGARDKYRGGRHLEAIRLIMGITGIEKAILHEIASHIDFRDFSSSRYMSLAEISKGTSFSHSSCYRAVMVLGKKGYIKTQSERINGKQAPNTYWLTERVFEQIEIDDELNTDSDSHSDRINTTTGSHSDRSKVSGSHTDFSGSHTDFSGSHTDFSDSHTDDEDPKHPKYPKNPLSISPPSPLPAPSQPDMPTVPRVKRDFIGAIAKPSLPKPRLDLLASLVNAANRPGRDDGGKAAFYPPHAEWAIAIRACAEKYSTADFDALLPYLVATKRQAQGVIAPGNLDRYLAESVAYAADPSSLKAQENQSMASYAEYMKRINKPKENTEVDWVSTLDIHELKSRLTDDKFPASKESYDRLLKRYLELGGIYGDLGGKTPKLVPSR